MDRRRVSIYIQSVSPIPRGRLTPRFGRPLPGAQPGNEKLGSIRPFQPGAQQGAFDRGTCLRRPGLAKPRGFEGFPRRDAVARLEGPDEGRGALEAAGKADGGHGGMAGRGQLAERPPEPALADIVGDPVVPGEEAIERGPRDIEATGEMVRIEIAIAEIAVDELAYLEVLRRPVALVLACAGGVVGKQAADKSRGRCRESATSLGPIAWRCAQSDWTWPPRTLAATLSAGRWRSW